MHDHVLMRLSAAILPPPLVREDLAAVLHAVHGSAQELEVVPGELLHLPLGHFGNVGVADRQELQETLTRELASRSPLQLRLSGGSALVDDGDDSVWTHLDGDVDELVSLGSAVPKAVQRLGFLIDRRVFRTRVRVGRITAHTTVPFLEGTIAMLQQYSGPAWTAHSVALLRHLSGDDRAHATHEVLHEIRLGGSPERRGAVPAPQH
jgi:2'-5' RNA ligase